MDGLIVFDDGAAGLAPVTDLRASFELRTGAWTTAARWAARLGGAIAGAAVPRGLAGVLSMRFGGPINRLPADGAAFLLVNGRWASARGPLPADRNTATVDDTGAVLAARLDRARAEAFLASVIASEATLPDGVAVVAPGAGAALLRRPWQVLGAMLDGNLDRDLAAMIAGRRDLVPFDAKRHDHAAVIGEAPVCVGRDVQVQPFVAFNTLKGPIVIDHGVAINAHAVVYGPCYIGPRTVLHNRADVGYSAIGPRCKLGGEVNVCLFQGHSNKSHSGYLGHSVIGEWVNLGASTVASNLKNTFGEVAMRVDPRGPAEKTGRQFLGSVIGDHARTAIGTRLMTGACVHTGAMIAVSGFAPTCVDPFAFLTDAGADRYDFDRFLLAADRMMQRRDQRVTAELAQRLAALHAGASAGASMAGGPANAQRRA